MVRYFVLVALSCLVLSSHHSFRGLVLEFAVQVSHANVLQKKPAVEQFLVRSSEFLNIDVATVVEP